MKPSPRTRPPLPALLLLVALLAVPAHTAHSAPPVDASPHYYYDRETAFLINYGIDPTYGGLFVAVNEDGALIEDFLPVQVWGFPPNVVRGVSKSHIGQATCVRYFVNEYLRVTVSGAGVGGINALLQPARQPLASPLGLLGYARSCADFVGRHMEVPPADSVSEPPSGNGLYPPGADQGDVAIPGRLFYWGFTGRSGQDELIDDTLPNGGLSAARAESTVPWSIAELALAMRRAGLPESEWGAYRDLVLRWWSWRRASAPPLPPYGDPNAPTFQDGCGGQPDNPDNCIPGIGRDIFYAPIGYALAELTGDPSYREGDGAAMADGMPYGARPFANSILGTGDSADLTFPPPHGLQDGTYPAGFARAIIYAYETQRLGSPVERRDQYWDFSIDPALRKEGDRYVIRPLSDPFFSEERLRRPFGHYGGRELIAGTQRTYWMFGTFGVNPNTFYASSNLQPEDFRAQAYRFWTFANTTFWDDTPGRQAWYEAVGHPYKPCFAGGTEVPIADWLPPVIASKVHSPEAPRPDQPVMVTVGGVRDPEWPYLSMMFQGSGIAAVEVRYSPDGGTTWATLPATRSGADYVASIPPQPVGTRVLYYARARDVFGNWAAFPEGAERWDSAGLSVTVGELAQSYEIPPTAIELASLSAAREGGAVTVRWETAAEIGTWGFHLLRSETGRRADAVRMTPQLIPAEGRGRGGASYAWRDAGALPGVTYTYWLQEVELRGATGEYGPVSTAPRLAAETPRSYLPLAGR